MKIICITILVCFAIICSAQSNAIDSLDKLINNATSDTARINLLNKKSALLGNINLDSAIAVAKTALQDAIKINYKTGEGVARIRLASNFCFKGDYNGAAENLKAAELIFKPFKDSFYIARLYAAYGMMNGMQSRYDTAIRYYEQSIGIDERHNNNDEIARSYSNIAISYQMRSSFAQALYYQQKALKIAEQRNDEPMQARALVNIGLLYFSLKDFTRAEEALLKSAALAKKNNVKIAELYAYSNLASVYETKQDYKKSYEYAIKSAELGGEMGDQGIQSTGYGKAATSLIRQNKFEEAEKLGRKAIAIADSSRQPLNIYQTYNVLANLYKTQAKYKEAIYYYEYGFAALKDADIYDEQFGVSYNELSQCYEQTGNYKKALEKYKIAGQIKDSIRSKENIRKATELTMNFEFDKKQQAAEAEQKQKDALSSSKQLALMIGLGFALALVIAIFIGYRNKLKAYALLRKQKEEINNAFTKLRTTQAQLIQAEKMAGLGELTAGIAHEIQNPLNFVNNFSEVSTELAEEIDEAINKGDSNEIKQLAKDIKENLEKITHHGKRAAAIVKNMLQHSRSGSGVKEPTDINQLVDEFLRLSYHGVRAKDKMFNATLKTHFDETIQKIDIIPQDIGRVILNLITNALYAVNDRKKKEGTGYNPEITVGTRKQNGKIIITVQDNGNGIPDTLKDKIFQPFFTTKPAGDGTGLGLSLSYDIITKAHGGELTVESKEKEGSTFIIVLPA